MQFQLTHNSSTNRAPSLSGVRRFKLTALFLIISALTFSGVAIAINFSSERSEEKNIISTTTQQSEKDAKLIAGIVVKLLAAEARSSRPPLAASAVSDDGIQLSFADFMRSSNIVRLSLYELDGTNSWSSTPDERSIDDDQTTAFNNAVAGTISSDLSRNRLVLDSNGTGYNADIVETFIPFMDSDQGVTISVLGVTRNVTSALASQSGATSSAIFRTTMISLGVAFAILLGTIISADRVIWRHRKLDVENTALQHINEEREKFLSTVSHELKTPLTSIMGLTDVLLRHQDGSDSETNLQKLEIVKRNGQHLLSLINDLLDSGEMQTGEVALKREEFTFDESLQTMVETMSPLIESKSQRLEIAMNMDNSTVQLDRRRIDQVLMNLVGNASKYSPDGTQIRVEARGIANELQLTVEDKGIGISQKDQRQLFTKFFRVDNETTRKVGGTGLGLAITKEIVEAHGGTISFWSELGVGSRMTVTIPGCILANEQTQNLSEVSKEYASPEENREDIQPDFEHIQTARGIIWGSAPRHGGFVLEPAIGKFVAVPPTSRRQADQPMPI